MDHLLQELREWGCDIDGAMDRFMGDKELYFTCLHTVVKDKAFAGLGESLKEERISDAFDFAHTLKGVLANMGLTPMFDIVVKIVEPLREGNSDKLLPFYEELISSNEHLKQMIKA